MHIDTSPGMAGGNATLHAARRLERDAFARVVADAPLVSIDLVIEDQSGAVLLGRRTNPPAQGSWFVPGGRILKGETLDQAFYRICVDELGAAFARSEADPIGVFEHFYDVDFTGAPSSTHYVVLAHRLKTRRAALRPPSQQHNRYLWLQPSEAVTRADVHPYTQAYFSRAGE
jgi:colanic acid biosynthesis protein WcaH